MGMTGHDRTVTNLSHMNTLHTRGSDCGPLLSEFDSFVVIERAHIIRGYRLWTAKKTVAAGKLSLDRVTLRWEGDHRLLVGCRCQKETLDFAIGQWRDVVITYTFSP
jgi:hypothetical protein